jgi:hypothetical protein
LTEIAQEVMTPHEAAKWFRRSISWLRFQRDLVRVAGPAGQPLYHDDMCRAFLLGSLLGLTGAALRRAQVEALAATCGVALRDWLRWIDAEWPADRAIGDGAESEPGCPQPG